MEGTNATIFVYGATGTGKTYTMMGNDKVAGDSSTAADIEDRPPRQRSMLAQQQQQQQQPAAFSPSGAGAGAGDSPQPGIVSLTLRHLFQRISTATREAGVDRRTGIAKQSWTVVVSYLEIYNENIRDLLSPSSRPLSLRENPALG